MKTIVEYSEEKPPENAYPERIVSPLYASPCCLSQMVPIGKRHQENGWRFIYKRCVMCGFTVRHFESVSPGFLPIRVIEGHWRFQQRSLLSKPKKNDKRMRVNACAERR